MPQILREAAELGGEQYASLDQLIEAAHTQPIRDLLIRAGTYLGIAVASLLNIYNPGLSVLGGPLAAAGELFLETVRATARRRALPITIQHCDIVAGTLGRHAVALGTASHIIQSVFSPPTLDTLVGQR